VVATQAFRLKEHDPAGFFVVLIDRADARLLVEHYTADGALGHRLAGADAESLCAALIEWQLLTRLDHAAYMGRELAKAEAALRLGIEYRQDERSEEHTSELQSRFDLVCRLLLEKKKQRSGR